MKQPTPNEIKATRLKLGLTQEQAAELAGVSRVTWARFEMGKHDSLPTPQMWAYFLHVAGIERIPFRKAQI